MGSDHGVFRGGSFRIPRFYLHDWPDRYIHTDGDTAALIPPIPGGAPGVKGISLFIVPKFRVNDDGSLGPGNNIALAGLNHKMGFRGTVTTVLGFGEGEF